MLYNYTVSIIFQINFRTALKRQWIRIARNGKCKKTWLNDIKERLCSMA